VADDVLLGRGSRPTTTTTTTTTWVRMQRVECATAVWRLDYGGGSVVQSSPPREGNLIGWRKGGYQTTGRQRKELGVCGRLRGRRVTVRRTTPAGEDDEMDSPLGLGSLIG
jgi:hypothetical protein